MKKIYMILAAITLLSLSLNAQTRATENVTDQITASSLAATSNRYVSFTGVTFTSEAVYAGNSALNNNTNIQLRSTTGNNGSTHSGIVTTTSGGKLKSITINVASGSNTIDVYGKNTAYSSQEDLYSTSTQGTKLGSLSSTGTITVTGDYEYLGIRSNSGAVYISSIDVVWEVDAGNTATLDLFSNTTDENMCLPVYGGYHDHTQHNQMVYPASLLTDMVGKKIKSMTFYPASVTYNGTTYSGIGFRNGSVTFKMMEVTGSTGFNSSNPSFITGSMTTVKTVTMPSSAQTSATTWKITFDQEYEYNGGDLVIDVTNVTGDYQRTYFYTGTTSIAYPGYYTYSGSTGSASVAVDYVPKVTFTYEVPADQHDLGITLSEPTAVTAGENATITATVTNHGNQTETGYTVTFSDGTNTFSTQTGGTLAPGATETFTATYTTSAAGTVTITANVACTGDADATNDEATTNLTVNAPVHDLGIALTATDEVVGGNDVTLTATVTNTGDLTETGYTVTFSDGTTTFSTQTGGTLAPGATETFTATYTTTAAQGGTNVTFTATVTCTGDADATNDEATASTAVILLPPPTNVVATPDGANATVTWNAPVIAPVVVNVTEDFEDTSVFPSFTTGGVDVNTHTGAFGNWTLYDATGGCVTYGSKQLDYEGEALPHAWFVFKPSGATASEDYPDAVPHAVHSGAQYLESICPTGSSSAAGVSDHWLISPELSGLAQTISFYVCELTTEYGSETYEIWVSTTDNDPSSFTKLGSTYTVNYTNWTEQTVQLAAGTKYFAIRHTSNNIFGLLIDDVTYEGLVPGVQPTSYNVYLDGTLVGNVDANDPLTYDFNNLADGDYTVEISAVYPLGESALVPATFTIDTTNPEITISPETQTIDDNAAGTLTVTGTDIESNINVGVADNTNWSLNPTSLSNTGGNVSVSYTGRDLTASTTVTASATGATDATATVNYVADLYIVGNFGSGWDFNNGTHMSYNNGIYTATLTANANSYILFARLLGNNNPWGTRDVFGPDSNGDWVMQGNSYGGNLNLYDSKCINFPEGGTYTITIDANNGTFTITRVLEGQTATPTINYTTDDEYVTITATGDGTVTLNVPGYGSFSGEGEVSVTIPRGYADNTITVTATAQEAGKEVSETESRTITIPAGSDWVQMDGTYSATDLLSFTKDGEDIMLVDQFLASTLKNDHPDHYTYTLRQTVNGETQTSTPVTIPVYKTSSTMQGLYTLGQIKSDKDMHLKANVLNTEMDYDVNPDNNVLYYSLYRGDLNETYPVIDVPHRVSQLQKFEDNTSGTVQYYMFENHQTGIAPRYDHLGQEIAERLDTNWVVGQYQDQLPYVPVIWTFGLYSGREDGKNNSYGSDIKRETLGEVTAEAKIYQTTSAWGKFKDSNNVEYCIYYPEIKITGVCPVTMTAGDGDVYTYEPYMFRAWCTYEGARDFTSVDNALVDNGPKTTPFMLDSVIVVDPSQNIVTIGRDWLPSDTNKLPWAFGVPVTEDPQNVTFIVRFYYRQVVQEGGQQEGGNKLRLGNDAEEFFIAEGAPSSQSAVTAVNELFGGSEVVSVTYYNAQGMQSSKPFKGMNIIVTRYSDGSTSTMKVMK